MLSTRVVLPPGRVSRSRLLTKCHPGLSSYTDLEFPVAGPVRVRDAVVAGRCCRQLKARHSELLAGHNNGARVRREIEACAVRQVFQSPGGPRSRTGQTTAHS